MSKQLVKSTAVVVTMTMLSRIFGFARDMITAYFFGAGAMFDAFTMAFKIPNFMRRLFAEGSFSQAFVPVLSEHQKKNSEEETKQFINAIAGSLSIVLLIVTIFGIIFAPLLVSLFAPGFLVTDGRYELTVTMLRITFPYLFFISLTAFSGAILNTYHRFWVAAFTPIFLNIVMITATIFLAPQFKTPIIGLAWGVFIAGVVQLLFQIPFLKKMHLLPKPRIAFKHPGVKRVLSLMVPALFGVSVGQINLLVDTLFVSFLTVGSVSWLYYSDRLMEFPLGVFGVAISTVILPNLSRHHAGESPMLFALTLDWALRAVLLMGIPATLVLSILAGPILSTLFQHGNFSAFSVSMAQQSLIAFALGITPFMLVKILASSFYAKQDMGTPVRVGVIAMITNIVFNIILIWPLKHAGIALATTLAAVINSGLLFYLLQKSKHYAPRAGWLPFLLRLSITNAVLAVGLYMGAGDLSIWVAQTIEWRIMHLAWLLISAVALYFPLLWLTGMRVEDLLIPKIINAT